MVSTMSPILMAAPKGQSRLAPNCCWIRFPTSMYLAPPSKSGTTNIPMAGTKVRMIPTDNPGSVWGRMAWVKTLTLDGQPSSPRNDCRFRVVADGREHWLTARPFEYLVKLAMATSLKITVHVDELGKARVYQNIGRLKSELPGLGIRSVGDGHYRLDMKPQNIKFNRDQLSKYPHHEISKMFSRATNDRR